MKKETNCIKLKYEFDSDYDDRYRKYDGEEFVYKIDEEDVKYDILKPEIKKLELDWNIYDLIDIFDNMCLWDVIFDEDTIEWLKDKYESDAMTWFKEQHLIEEEEE